MSKFEAFKMRAALLRIWALKNLGVFLNLFFVVGIILVFTGQINENTPVLGGIFGDISIALREALTQGFSTDRGGDIFVNSITAILTFLVTIGLLSTNVKRIAISDIKSVPLKRAMVSAGLYFNSDGKLVNRLEEAAKIDLNGDGKIGDTGLSIDDIPKEGLFPGLKRAGEELNTIMTLKINEESHVEEIKEKAGLAEVEKMSESIRVAAADDSEKRVSDEAVKLLAKKVDKRTSLFVLASNKIRVTTKGAFDWVRSLLKKKPKSKKKEEKRETAPEKQPEPQKTLTPREARNLRSRQIMRK
jgi:hypothetical protein